MSARDDAQGRASPAPHGSAFGARDNILLRIRQTRRTERASEELVQSRLYAHPRGPLPSIDADLVARFCARATSLASDVRGPVTASDAPATIAAYLSEKQLPLQAVCWPRLQTMNWSQADLTVEARSATGADLVGITGAFCAIAETGTLMLLSGPETPATVSLLPETHIALLPLARIVARMEDGWDLLRRDYGALPRTVNFISGPSRTADIEQTVTLGAHGPYRVCIVLVSDDL
jgi:L-lactate dehydrogenase complex protein LldG